MGSFSAVITQKGVTPLQTTARHRFSYRVAEGAYSRALNRHILTGNTPQALHIFDPISRADQSIALARPPTSLALSLDGLLAVVGHDGGVSAINLKLGEVVAFFPVPLEVRTLAVTPRGIVFAFPGVDETQNSYYPFTYLRGVSVSLDLSTGRTLPLARPLSSVSSIQLWPDGLTLFADGVRWAVNGNVLNALDSYGPSICGRFWFTHGGSRILTSCGIFHSATDFSFQRSLGATVPWADSSTALVTTAALFESQNPQFESDRVALIPDSTLVGSGFVLQPYSAESRSFPLRGRLVNWNSDSTRLHVLSDLGGGLPAPAGSNITIAESFSTQTPCAFGVTAAPRSVPAEGTGFGLFTVAPENCLWQPVSAASWVQIRNRRVFFGSAAVDFSVLPNLDPTPREALVTMGGRTVSITQAAASLVLSPASLSVSAMPSEASVQILAADPGVRWTAVAQVRWISLLQSSGVAPANLTFSVAPNPGAARVGSFSVNGNVFTVVQAGSVAASNQPPVVLPPFPTRFATRSFQFADPDGVADLAILSVLINSSLDGREACHFAYDMQAALLYLVARDGAGATASRIGVPGELSNGICQIDTESVALIRGPHSVTLRLAYSLGLTGFSGRAIYGAARDRQGSNSGWQLIGFDSLPSAILPNPTNSLASPPLPEAPLAIAFDDINTSTGFQRSTNIKFAQVLVQNALDARGACYVGFDRDNNLLYLMDDEGTRLLPTPLRLNGAPGGVPRIENSQCRITAQGSSFRDAGSVLTLTLNLSYKPAFAGPRLIFGGAQTTTSNSRWQMLGFLAVP